MKINCERLTIEEEQLLLRKAKAGDIEARNRLIKANLPMIIHVANKYTNSSVPTEDLIGEGTLGMITAIKKFELKHKKKVKLMSYAIWWVRQAIIVYTKRHGRTVSIPSDLLHVMSQLDRGKITEAAAKKHLKGSDERIASIKQLRDAVHMPELVDDLKCTEFEDSVKQKVYQEYILHLMQILTLKEKQVVMWRYGFTIGAEGESRTLEYIGRILGVTKERVRQIVKSALTKLYRESLILERKVA